MRAQAPSPEGWPENSAYRLGQGSAAQSLKRNIPETPPKDLLATIPPIDRRAPQNLPAGDPLLSSRARPSLDLAMSALILAAVAAAATFAAPAMPPIDGDRLVVGDPAPALSTEHWVKGEAPAELQRGTVYVIEFWATWCKPCIASFPHLSELQERYADELVILSVSDESLDTVTPFLAKEKHASVTHYTMGTDPDRSMYSDWMEAAQMRGIPTAFIVDREGIIQYIGHPMGMDAALRRVVTGEEPDAAAMSDMPERDMSEMFAVEGTHSEAALEQLNELQQRLGAAGGEVTFTQRIVLKGALRMGGPDGEAMDLKSRREGTMLTGGALGVHVTATRTMEIPGMPGGGMTENEVLLATSDRLIVKRSSDSPFAPSPFPTDGWMGMSRQDATDFANKMPSPLPALVMMDTNPVLASPLDLLARIVELTALEVTTNEDGRMVLEGQGAAFVGMPTGPESMEEMESDGQPEVQQVDVRLEIVSGDALEVTLIVGAVDAPQFSMTLSRLPSDAANDPALFSTGDEEVQDLLPILKEKMEQMMSMAGSGF